MRLPQDFANARLRYSSEISPAPLRGLMSGSMTVLVTVGNTIGAGVNLPFGNEQRSLGWIVSWSALDTVS